MASHPTLNIQEAIARAKAMLAQREAEAAAKKEQRGTELAKAMNLTIAAPSPLAAQPIADSSGFTWNAEQQTAIDHARYRKNFCLIGAAGTGKTTTLKGALITMLKSGAIPPLDQGTKHLSQGAPGIALISYTRRAVRNIAKQMPPELKSHCLTFHKLVEYEPFFYTEWNDEKECDVNKMRFQPARHVMNPLPASLRTIVIDEASMLSTEYFAQLLDALPFPSQVQFIVLGDLNQLPPVYGQAILGAKLLEYPIIELTQVYRQALESPIIALALAVKNNNFQSFVQDAVDKWGVPAKHQFADERENNPINYAASFDPKNLKDKVVLESSRGKVTIHPWKKTLEQEDALYAMQGQLKRWILDGTYVPEEDLVLCPWNKSFGTDELNLAIADVLSTRDNLPVWEIIAGFNKYYYSVGDKLMVDKMDAQIVDIKRNPKYLGKQPRPVSAKMNRWGAAENSSAMFDGGDSALTDADIDLMLLHASDVTDRTTEASHTVRVRFLDTDEERDISDSATLNATSFGYAITVHKAQGSECRRVFFLTHACHAAMCSRELVYTAITRAAEELYILMTPNMLGKAASKPRIKGDTLAEKLAFYTSRMQEKAE